MPHLRRTMLSFFAVILFTSSAAALEPMDDFDPILNELWDAITVEGGDPVVGEIYAVNLEPRLISHHHAVFEDAFIYTGRDSNERYQFAKWEFEPEIVTEFVDTEADEVHVEFVIKSVEVDEPYHTTPHIVAEIIRMSAITEQPIGEVQ